MERQYQAMQTAFTADSINGLRPTIRLRFTQSGVEVMIRFPADRQRAAEIDERVTLELQKELDREPKLKLVGSGSGPSIIVKTDLVDG